MTTEQKQLNTAFVGDCLMTIVEAAEALGVTEWACRELVVSGELRAFRRWSGPDGKVILIPAEDVERREDSGPHEPWCNAHHYSEADGDGNWCESTPVTVDKVEVHLLDVPSDGPAVVVEGLGYLTPEEARRIAATLNRHADKITPIKAMDSLDHIAGVVGTTLGELAEESGVDLSTGSEADRWQLLEVLARRLANGDAVPA